VQFDPNVSWGEDYDFGERAFKEFGNSIFKFDRETIILVSSRMYKRREALSKTISAMSARDGFNGIRVGSLDPRDYAGALERLLVDGELWSRLSRNGLEFVKRFDHVEVAKRYLSIIGGLRER
jgi:hypothetical protein